MTRSDPPYPDAATPGRIPLTLTIGPWSIGIRGLDHETAARLTRRWGGFSRPGLLDGSDLQLFCIDRTAGDGLGLGSWRKGEVYRMEGALVDGRPMVRSYNFCMAPAGDDAGTWKLVLGGAPGEPLERTVENAVRCLVSRLALMAGGFALHGAGVRRSGQTWIYAGESGAGKTTAVRLTEPCESLGDDFAVALPVGPGWSTCAVPFDNREQAPLKPTAGLLPLGAILRLFQAGAGEPSRVEVPESVLSTASLMTSVMLPGLFADLGNAVLENAARFAADRLFGHLHFHKNRLSLDRVQAFISSAG